MNNEEMIERILKAYARAVALADPGRLERWVGLGLTTTQLRVLVLLRREAGAPAGFLAERLRITPSTLTRIVDRLVRLGLVRREEDSVDRRLVRHYLTARGDQTLAEMKRAGRAFVVKILSQLPRHKLERLLHALEDLSQAAETAESRVVSTPETGS
jgi:DNA-binding MarR family transcriptional regulator